jgi:Tol biopolymer transport system component
MRVDGASGAALATGLLALLAGACGERPAGGSEPRPAPSAGEGSGARQGWELVYEQEVDGNVDLYLVAATDGTSRRLTSDPAYDCHARWMPDGKQIVFTSNRSGTPQLWMLSPGGGPPRRLRRNRAEESQPDPSPDGRSIAFLSDLDGPQRLLVMDVASGATSELVRHGARTIFGNPHWSPDGSRIAFSSNWKGEHRIYVVDTDTREVTPVVGGCEPRFSRSGRAVSYVQRPFPSSTSRLVERDLETGEERVLVDWPSLCYDLAYSPDGAEVAFASDIDGEYALYRQRLSDGRAWRVTFGGGAARYPDYRPLVADD